MSYCSLVRSCFSSSLKGDHIHSPALALSRFLFEKIDYKYRTTYTTYQVHYFQINYYIYISLIKIIKCFIRNHKIQKKKAVARIKRSLKYRTRAVHVCCSQNFMTLLQIKRMKKRFYASYMGNYIGTEKISFLQNGE